MIINTTAARLAALAAAAINAEGWREIMKTHGEGPFADPDLSGIEDDIHVDELNAAMERVAGREMTDAEHVAAYPVYVAELARLTRLA